MKLKVISELIAAMIIGTLVRLHVREDYLKWHGLGREAFLQNKTHFFDNCIASPPSSINLSIVFVVYALLFYAAFKTLTFGIAALISTVFLKGGQARTEF